MTTTDLAIALTPCHTFVALLLLTKDIAVRAFIGGNSSTCTILKDNVQSQNLAGDDRFLVETCSIGKAEDAPQQCQLSLSLNVDYEAPCQTSPASPLLDNLYIYVVLSQELNDVSHLLQSVVDDCLVYVDAAKHRSPTSCIEKLMLEIQNELSLG